MIICLSLIVSFYGDMLTALRGEDIEIAEATLQTLPNAVRMNRPGLGNHRILYVGDSN